MSSRLFGVLTCGTFLITSAVYLSFGDTEHQTENSTSVTANRSFVGSDESETGIFRWNQKSKKATSLVAVGWNGCIWCEKLKKEILSVLLKEGYDVRYVDKRNWKGPKIKAGPTLFYFDGKKIIKVEKGYQTVRKIKETLVK